MRLKSEIETGRLIFPEMIIIINFLVIGFTKQTLEMGNNEDSNGQNR